MILMNIARMERLLLEYSNLVERKKEIEKLIIQEKERIENIRDTLKAPKNDGTPHNNKLYDSVFEAVQKIIDDCSTHLEYYNLQMKNLNEVERIVLNGLSKLTKNEYKIVELRYFKGYSWNSIFPLIHYQETKCYELRNDALKKLCESIQENI